jgi:hypothetical protein
VLVAFALYLQTHITVDSGYSVLLPAFMIMGVGMGLTMSPMSTAAMNAVEVTKAGVASGILSMSRMVGGTFGVAALGALFQSLASSRLDHLLAGTSVAPVQREAIVENLGSGRIQESLRGLDPEAARQAGDAAKEAFVHALASGMWLAGGVALAGAATALALIGRLPTRRTDPAAQAEAAAA